MTGPVDDYDDDDDDFDDGYGPRRRWIPIAVAAVVVAAGVGIGLGVGLSGGSPQLGPEGVPLQNVPDLASADSTVKGTPLGGIRCLPSMNPSYHVHTHLAIYVNGVQKRIPAGAGIVNGQTKVLVGGIFIENFDSSSSTCLYWLHVHADDGIIHVEAPSERGFTLGQFFDVWGQSLSADQVGPARGSVVAFVDGRRIDGNQRDIALLDHRDVQLDVGSPVVAFKPLKFTVSGLCGPTCGGTTTTTTITTT